MKEILDGIRNKDCQENIWTEQDLPSSPVRTTTGYDIGPSPTEVPASIQIRYSVHLSSSSITNSSTSGLSILIMVASGSLRVPWTQQILQQTMLPLRLASGGGFQTTRMEVEDSAQALTRSGGAPGTTGWCNLFCFCTEQKMQDVRRCSGVADGRKKENNKSELKLNSK